MSPESIEKLCRWALLGQTGISSKTMAVIALKMHSGLNLLDAPYDCGDLARCFLLVDQVPEIREHFAEIETVCPKFKPGFKNWDRWRQFMFRGSGEYKWNDQVWQEMRKGDGE